MDNNEHMMCTCTCTQNTQQLIIVVMINSTLVHVHYISPSTCSGTAFGGPGKEAICGLDNTYAGKWNGCHSNDGGQTYRE